MVLKVNRDIRMTSLSFGQLRTVWRNLILIFSAQHNIFSSIHYASLLKSLMVLFEQIVEVVLV